METVTSLGEDAERIDKIYPFMADKLKKDTDTFTAGVNGEAMEVITNTVPITDWKIVQIVLHKEIFKQIAQMRSIIFTILFICITAFIAIIIIISTMVTKPLRKSTKSMEAVQIGKTAGGMPVFIGVS